MSGLVAPVVLLLVLLATDVWVYRDQRKQIANGTPVTLRLGSVTIASAEAWLIGCVIVWILFFPLYIAGRHN